MIEWYKKVVFANYANFNGRARRSEYWYFTLVQFITFLSLIVLSSIAGAVFGSALGGVLIGYMLFALYALVTVIPTIAVVVRRLHDVGKSGWFYFICLIPLIGGIWLLVLMCTEGDSGSNEYGPDPKNETDAINEIGKVELQ
jgi:uncharacterized membrane protein YhaH (DUF805 family)